MSRFSKVLITGGAGFIGSHLVDRLLQKGFEVTVFDNLSTGKIKNIESHLHNSAFHFAEGDVRAYSLLKQHVETVDCAIHLAAVASVPSSVKQPSLAHEVNATGTLNLLKACVESGIKRILYMSSSAVYGEPSYLPIDEKHPTSPISPLAASKLAAEDYCKAFHESHALETVVFRLFNAYGSRQNTGDEGAVVANFVERLRNGLPLIVYGNGTQTRDFVHVNDIVEAILLALENRDARLEIFNIGFGISTPINELARLLKIAAGSDLRIIFEDSRVGDIKRSHANIEKARKMLGYTPRIALQEGLKLLLEENR